MITVFSTKLYYYICNRPTYISTIIIFAVGIVTKHKQLKYKINVIGVWFNLRIFRVKFQMFVRNLNL
jgi:hypothetical protein